MSESRRIAIVGASRNRRKFGNKCVRAYLEAGWTVFPINPAASEVEGLATYPSLEELPEGVDRISLYTPPARTLSLLDALPAGVEVFFNPGTANAAILEAARARGLDVRDSCSIVDIGLSPSQFSDQDTE